MSSKSTYYINSIPIEPNKYGSKNDTPIKAIGVFNFDINELSEFEIIRFSFPNLVDNRIEEVVIPYIELRNRILHHNYYPKKLLVLWLLPNGRLYNATNIGAEGEWWFIAGGMGENTLMDFTQFFNEWQILNLCLK